MDNNVKIKFTNMMGIPEEYYPKPASRYVPEWYKELNSYIDGEKKPNGNGNTTATIKKCMPVFDSINAGYIIPSPCDVWIGRVPVNPENPKITQPTYEWSNFGIIQFHPVEQAPTYPNNSGHEVSYPKWINPWSIKTPPGYSTLFIEPLHRESVFSILPGVVDTDKYTAPVNFPFVLKNIEFKGLIPAGTPIVQAIPFKRDSWEMELGSEEDMLSQNKVFSLLRTKFFDSYKTIYRQKKEYK